VLWRVVLTPHRVRGASQAQLLSPTAADRPTVAACLAHPFWWPAEMRLSFLVDVSERVELEDREQDRSLLAALEARPAGIGGGIPGVPLPWDAALHAALLDNLSRYRRYDGRSVRDLLRVVRNKRAHWRELPPAARAVKSPSITAARRRGAAGMAARRGCCCTPT
jgi:serine/threonine-protein kinase/endoribonuclease IRE1